MYKRQGLRGPLAEEISRGLLAEPVQIHSHGGRVHLVQSGELNIEMCIRDRCCTPGSLNSFRTAFSVKGLSLIHI